MKKRGSKNFRRVLGSLSALLIIEQLKSQLIDEITAGQNKMSSCNLSRKI